MSHAATTVTCMKDEAERERAHAIFDPIAQRYLEREGVDIGAMFGSEGLRAVGEEPAADELPRLRREILTLKLENDILKKAAVILGTRAQPSPAR